MRRKATPLTGVTWGLLTYNNGKGGLVSVLSGTEITAVFGEDGNLAGSAGCNDYAATYSTDGDSISIGPAATTRKMCTDPEGIMEQEAGYLAAFRVRWHTRSLTGPWSWLMRMASGWRHTQSGHSRRRNRPRGRNFPAIIGAPWQWVATLYNNDTKAMPENPENYVLELMQTGS